MKAIFLCATMFALSWLNAAGQAKTLTQDALTGLPLSPATSPGNGLGNQPTDMPDSHVCKSQGKAVFYSLYNIKIDAATAWYAAHLSGFKKMQDYASGRSQTAFYSSDGTTLI